MSQFFYQICCACTRFKSPVGFVQLHKMSVASVLLTWSSVFTAPLAVAKVLVPLGLPKCGLPVGCEEIQEGGGGAPREGGGGIHQH